MMMIMAAQLPFAPLNLTSLKLSSPATFFYFKVNKISSSFLFCGDGRYDVVDTFYLEECFRFGANLLLFFF